MPSFKNSISPVFEIVATSSSSLSKVNVQSASLSSIVDWITTPRREAVSLTNPSIEVGLFLSSWPLCVKTTFQSTT